MTKYAVKRKLANKTLWNEADAVLVKYKWMLIINEVEEQVPEERGGAGVTGRDSSGIHKTTA